MPDDPSASSEGLRPEEIRGRASSVVERAAEALREQLVEVAAQADPFPAFPGAVFAYGIEVEPAGGGDPGLGCVILGNDGQLYELQIGLDDVTGSATTTDASTERHEELVPLDVAPDVFVRYAYAAIEAAAQHLGERGSS